mgnify:FL=1
MNFILEMSDRKYVVDNDQLDIIQGILDDCEIFSSEYNRSVGNADSFYTNHVYKQESTEGIRSVNCISAKTLVMARLAGRKKD